MNVLTNHYRVWDKRLEDYVKKPKRFQLHSWGLAYFGGISVYQQKNRYVVQRFTGLFDKYNLPIYEGDIVRVHIPHETKTSYTSEVFFTSDGVLVKCHPAHEKISNFPRLLSDFCGRYSYECQVIGSIFRPNYIEQQSRIKK